MVNMYSGVPQGSVLSPFSSVFMRMHWVEPDAKFNLYADDTVIYCCGSTLAENLQIIFNDVEQHLIDLKMVLIISKTKLIIFSNGRKMHQTRKQSTSYVASILGFLLFLLMLWGKPASDE